MKTIRFARLGLLGLLGAALLLGPAGGAWALTTADGTITWNGGTAPLWQVYGFTDQNCGSLMYAESAIYYPTGGNWGPYGAAYLPYVPYQDGANTLDATGAPRGSPTPSA